MLTLSLALRGIPWSHRPSKAIEKLTPPGSHALYLFIHINGHTCLTIWSWACIIISSPEYMLTSYKSPGRDCRKEIQLRCTHVLKALNPVWSLAVIHQQWHYLKLCFLLSHLRYHCALLSAQLPNELQAGLLVTAASPPVYAISGPWLTAQVTCVFCSAGQACACWRVGNGCTYIKSSDCSAFLWGLGRCKVEMKSLVPFGKTYHQMKEIWFSF